MILEHSVTPTSAPTLHSTLVPPNMLVPVELKFQSKRGCVRLVPEQTALGGKILMGGAVLPEGNGKKSFNEAKPPAPELLGCAESIPGSCVRIILLLSEKVIFKGEKAFAFSNPDTLLSHDMYLLKSEDDLPLSMLAFTPVLLQNSLCNRNIIRHYP